MVFEPKGEQELREAMVWPEGEYDFEVTDCEFGESKKGNPMLSLQLKVFHPLTGKTRTVRDWLVESSHPMCLMKLRHYCAATGHIDAYDSGDIGNFPGSGAAGRCKLSVETDSYGTKNTVADYVKPKVEGEEKPSDRGVPRSQTERANQAFSEVAGDDEIPF